MKTNQSYYQSCMKIIKARENCLDKLKDAIFTLSYDLDNSITIREDDNLLNCCTLITHLRLLTISSVEMVVGWREWLYNLQKMNRGFNIARHRRLNEDIPIFYF
jgi:hypothetical protein